MRLEVILLHLFNLTLVSGGIYLIATFSLGIKAQTIMNPSNEPIAQQQSPASTYQPGFWQPVARVNPNNPVTANIINQSGIPIEYSLTTSPLGTRTVANGSNTQLEDLEKDSYIIINAQSSSTPVQFEITTENNLVNVTVTRSSDLSGESTVHLHPTGAIYKY
ncbi:hypothetical protein ACL6C3_02505 [Capilliphycus salinus ALCB114379]|uniref:hypothetical protein n=1 Tax=Capilliphycus salinus TaxID=2768948 RepID=UPI0039A55E67